MDPRPLFEVIETLDEYPSDDRFEPGPTIFSERPWTAQSPAVVLHEDALQGVAPSLPSFAYLLEVELAREVLGVWSVWRDGRSPTTVEATAAVIHYATHDAYLPADP